MKVDLNERELETLRIALRARLDELMGELVHTQQRPYRSEVRGDYEQLEQLLKRFDAIPAPAITPRV